jgi:hypothetical protein
MAIAALVTWLITAVGGFALLGTWIAKGGTRKPANTHFPPAVIFGHFALAAIGLVVWIIYVLTDNDTLAWTGFGLLVPVALLGFVMLARWIPTYRAGVTSHAGPGAAVGSGEPAERHFPVAIVAGHGVFAVATVVLALLAAAGI